MVATIGDRGAAVPHRGDGRRLCRTSPDRIGQGSLRSSTWSAGPAATSSDGELRRASERFVAILADRDVRVVTRGRAEGTAAAVLWSVAMVNGAFDTYGVLVKDMMAKLGLAGSSPSQRADALLRTAGVGWGPGVPRLGRVDLLTSAGRLRLMRARDELLSGVPHVPR